MKKKFSNLGTVLNKQQQRNINGGNSGSCGMRLKTGEAWCGMSKRDAQIAAANTGGYWCCDSCGGNGGGASYC